MCDIVGHVVGDRLDLGHGVAHGDSRLDRSEHAQVVARIAKAKGARISLATQIRQRSRHAHALVDALGAQLAILATGVAQLKLAIDKAIIVGHASQTGHTEAYLAHAQTAVDAHFLGAVHHRSADQRRLLNAHRLQGKSSHVGLEKGLNPCRGHTARKLLDNVLVKAVLMHHAALDLERRSRHGNDTRRLQSAQTIGN